VIGHFFANAKGAELARLSPRVKRAESDWQATVTLGCPRWELLNLKARSENQPLLPQTLIVHIHVENTEDIVESLGIVYSPRQP
jgi:hypothetical protein